MKKIIFILIFILAFSGITLAEEEIPIKLLHIINNSNSGTVFFYTIQEEFKKSATFEVNNSSPLKMYLNTTLQNNSLSYSVIWVMVSGEREIFLDSSLGIVNQNKYEYHTKNIIASTNRLMNTIKNSY